MVKVSLLTALRMELLGAQGRGGGGWVSWVQQRLATRKMMRAQATEMMMRGGPGQASSGSSRCCTERHESRRRGKLCCDVRCEACAAAAIPSRCHLPLRADQKETTRSNLRLQLTRCNLPLPALPPPNFYHPLPLEHSPFLFHRTRAQPRPVLPPSSAQQQ